MLFATFIILQGMQQISPVLLLKIMLVQLERHGIMGDAGLW
jgi:hypothetical protein